MTRLVLAAMLTLLLAVPVRAASAGDDPIRFFEGKTESLGTVKIAMKKPFVSRAIGNGKILPDGSLDLVQMVEDDGQPPRERRWRMKKVAPGRYTGSMTDAKGPVMVEEFRGKFRFRFRMDGNISVEQWLIPTADGRAAKSTSTIKKFGINVGKSDAVIRKMD